MATGNPKTTWRASLLPGAPKLRNGAADSSIALTYDGKGTGDTAREHGDIVPVWRFGEVRSSWQSKLFFGDNLPLLVNMANDPTVCGQVRLIYIDPPYATNSVFQSRSLRDAYPDLVIGSRYLESLRVRLVLLSKLLAEDGSIYVHLDENMVFHVKVLMDEIFGIKNFRNFITRRKCSSKNYTRRTYGNVSDYILFYTKSAHYVWNRPAVQWEDDHAEREYPFIEPETGRRYKKVPVHAPGVRNGECGKAWRGMKPPVGRHWKCSPANLDLLDARGEIAWSPTGNPRKKVYLDKSAGVPVTDIWLDSRDAHNQNVKITGYPTEKNESMLERIVLASSMPGDIVLDCYSGSGTTLSAAAALRRRFIGIDNSREAITATVSRFLFGKQRLLATAPKRRRSTIAVPALRQVTTREAHLSDRAVGFAVYASPNEALSIARDIAAVEPRSHN
jgi:adenine-specific DNA-methyltransferase